MKVFLSTAYFPNIQYFNILSNNQEVTIEIHESFVKQSYRNRTTILSANGIFNLIVPVCHAKNGKIKTKDVRISYIENWQHQHKIAILSAYGSSPYFEYFSDFILSIFSKKFDFLIDLNMFILENFSKILKLNTNIKFTENFVKELDNDYRYSISPKQPLTNITTYKPYIQVFSDRFDFFPNLSIIDLLMNTGPNALSYLKMSN